MLSDPFYTIVYSHFQFVQKCGTSILSCRPLNREGREHSIYNYMSVASMICSLLKSHSWNKLLVFWTRFSLLSVSLWLLCICIFAYDHYVIMHMTTLSRRVTMQLAAGGPKIHMHNNHNDTISRENLVQNTSILFHECDFNRLQIMEAILIQELMPTISNQNTGTHRTLKLL